MDELLPTIERHFTIQYRMGYMQVVYCMLIPREPGLRLLMGYGDDEPSALQAAIIDGLMTILRLVDAEEGEA